MTHDRKALFEARLLIRKTWLDIGKLRQSDPEIVTIRTRLNDLCIDITEVMEVQQPELILYPMEAV